MQNFVFFAVLLAALCHAGWNALIKLGLDPLGSATLITLGSAVIALAMLPFFVMPAAASWPWLIVSAIIHLFYFAALAEAYRSGDLGQVYPIARGSAPLMTAAATTLFVGERLGPIGWAGIIALVLGVVLLSARGGRDFARFDKRAVAFALFTAASICIYSVADGIGARLSGEPVSYSLWLFVGIAVTLTPYTLVRAGPKMLHVIAPSWRRGLLGGGMQVAAYGTVLWAMTLAPIAIVAALRETGVLFGAIIAVIVLKEPMRTSRLVAALMIVAGLVLIRIQ